MKQEKMILSSMSKSLQEDGGKEKKIVQKIKELWKLETVLGMIYISVGVRVGLGSRNFNCTHRLVAHVEVVERLVLSEMAFRLRGRGVVRREIGSSHWQGWEIYRLARIIRIGSW